MCLTWSICLKPGNEKGKILGEKEDLKGVSCQSTGDMKRGTRKDQWGERFIWGGWKGREEEGVG